ncbi:MAG: N-acetylglucosamine-6-phosphate deacetylase [Eubacteriales bacterium]|nr:N-acetylglucosamine-6-phosphate deacetylase [Eubacteriales bacterium]
MIIKNGKIFLPDGIFSDVELRVQDGVIREIAKTLSPVESEEVVDAAGGYVIPGLVDIHFHGCMGHDFCEGTKEAFDAITGYELKHGVTSISPATMTMGEDTLERVFAQAGSYRTECGSALRGITMEGPFVSHAKKGAQNADYIRKPEKAFFDRMQSLCGGLIRQVAVAPEEDEKLSFTRAAHDEVVVSVAHTTADYEMASTAFEAGATHVTHLFNAMPAFTHRSPGVVGAAFDHKDVFVELICDGIHIHPSMVRAAFQLFGAERICMISDSMMATGMPNGDYELGGQPVKVVGRLATLADGTIAGSASNLMDCLRVAVQEMGIALEEAVRASTQTPARSLGLDGECGSIAVGRAADLVMLDQSLQIRKIYKDGACVDPTE